MANNFNKGIYINYSSFVQKDTITDFDIFKTICTWQS